MPQRDLSALASVYITDSRLNESEQISLVERLLQGGIRAIQLRDHQARAADLYKLGLKLRKLTQKFSAALLVNDRLDVALAVGADGVHLGRMSIPPPIARKILGPEFLIGFSAHSLDEIHQVDKQKINYCSLSPIFYPKSKQTSIQPLGLDRLKQICIASRFPVVALGGIEPITSRACRKAGAIGVAAIGSLSEAEDPFKAAVQMSDQTELAVES